MRKFLLYFSVIALFLVSLTACGTIDGYYYNVDDARKENKAYKEADYIFTEEAEDVITDFVLKDHILYIIEIDCQKAINKVKYSIRAEHRYAIEEHIYVFNKEPKYNWTNSTKLSLKEYNWCIVSEEFNKNNDKLPSFNFIYDNESYDLCYDTYE